MFVKQNCVFLKNRVFYIVWMSPNRRFFFVNASFSFSFNFCFNYVFSICNTCKLRSEINWSTQLLQVKKENSCFCVQFCIGASNCRKQLQWKWLTLNLTHCKRTKPSCFPLHICVEILPFFFYPQNRRLRTRRRGPSQQHRHRRGGERIILSYNFLSV